MSPTYLFILLPILAIVVGVIVAIYGFKRWHAKGIFLGVLVAFLLFVVSETTIIPLAVLQAVFAPSNIDARQKYGQGSNAAISGASSASELLPVVKGIDKLLVGYGFGLSKEVQDCYHSQIDFLYGTSIDSPIAFGLFTQGLEATGWTTHGLVLERSREFVRGENDLVGVEYGGDYIDLWKQQGYSTSYLSMTTHYSNTLFVRVDYFLPSRTSCGQ